MAKKFREKLRKFNPFTRPMTLDELPKPLPANPDQRLVKVYVEGYEDVASGAASSTISRIPTCVSKSRSPTAATCPRARRSSWA